MYFVRKEKKKEHRQCEILVQNVFQNDDAHQYDHYKLCRLRGEKDFLPELSFVAEEEKKIVGYVTLSKATIHYENETKDSLFLFVIAITKEAQKKGAFDLLLRNVIAEAKYLGYKHLFVYGEGEAYASYGFVPAYSCGIKNGEQKKDKQLLVLSFDQSFPYQEGYLEISNAYNEVHEEEYQLYKKSIDKLASKRKINPKIITRTAFVFAILFFLAALACVIVRLVLKDAFPGYIAMGSVLLAIAGCLMSIGVSDIAKDKIALAVVSFILSIFPLIAGIALFIMKE